MSNIRDPVTGEFRKDVKVLHLKILSEDAGEIEEVSTAFLDILKRTGLDEEYIPIVTGPLFELRVDTVQKFIDMLSSEKEAVTKAEAIDNLIKGLKKARTLRWKQEDDARKRR